MPYHSSTARLVVAIAALVLSGAGCRRGEPRPAHASDSTNRATAAPCRDTDRSLTLPPGFCATIFADSLGRARHLTVSDRGVVYVNTWGRRGRGATSSPGGGFVVALRDTTGDGRADVIRRFGATPATGGGGTGIGIFNGHLYVEERGTIVRYTLPPAGEVAPVGSPVTVLRGLPTTGDHPAHPFVIAPDGAMYVNSGSASNSCQVANRTLESPGRRPCTELRTRAGIWRYDARRTGQRFSPAGRYATGIRNAIGLALAPDGALYATQHGRDQLAENWPKLYQPRQGAELPAEELVKVERGADYGWSECYFDGTQRRLVLAPEYGGDGKKIGVCATKRGPVAFFPAHWAPDGLLFYTGSQFPAHYRGGAFIAFHGSWNRAPFPQEGYDVVFVPFTGDRPGKYEIFANGFAGGQMQPDRAAHRPAGLAQGPDGALYVSDDHNGRVWRITYTGAK